MSSGSGRGPTAEPLLDLHRLVAGIRWRRRGWLAAAALGLIAGALFTLLLPSGTTASARVFVAHQDERAADPETLMETDVAVFETSRIAAAALQRLGIDEPAEKFLARYTGEAVAGNVLQLTVRGSSEADAVARAQALADVFIADHVRRTEQAASAEAKALLDRRDQAERELAQLNDTIAATAARANRADPQDLAAQFEGLYARRAALGSQIQELGQRAQDAGVGAPRVAAGTQVLDAARVTSRPLLVEALVTAAVGGVLGLGLGLVFAGVATLVQDRPVLRRDIAAHLGASVIVQLPAPRRGPARLWRRSRAVTDRQRAAASLARLAREAPDGVALLEVGCPGTAAALALDVAERIGVARPVVLLDDLPGPQLSELVASSGSAVRRVPAAEDPDAGSELGAPSSFRLGVGSVGPGTAWTDLRRLGPEALLVVRAGRASAAWLHTVARQLADADVLVLGVVLVAPDPRDKTDGTLWDGLHTALRGRVPVADSADRPAGAGSVGRPAAGAGPVGSADGPAAGETPAGHRPAAGAAGAGGSTTGGRAAAATSGDRGDATGPGAGEHATGAPIRATRKKATTAKRAARKAPAAAAPEPAGPPGEPAPAAAQSAGRAGDTVASTNATPPAERAAVGDGQVGGRRERASGASDPAGPDEADPAGHGRSGSSGTQQPGQPQPAGQQPGRPRPAPARFPVPPQPAAGSGWHPGAPGPARSLPGGSTGGQPGGAAPTGRPDPAGHPLVRPYPVSPANPSAGPYPGTAGATQPLLRPYPPAGATGSSARPGSAGDARPTGAPPSPRPQPGGVYRSLLASSYPATGPTGAGGGQPGGAPGTAAAPQAPARPPRPYPEGADRPQSSDRPQPSARPQPSDPADRPVLPGPGVTDDRRPGPASAAAGPSAAGTGQQSEVSAAAGQPAAAGGRQGAATAGSGGQDAAPAADEQPSVGKDPAAPSPATTGNSLPGAAPDPADPHRTGPADATDLPDQLDPAVSATPADAVEVP